MSYNSGVDSLETLLGIGLMTSQNTSELESMPEPKNSRNKSTKLSRRLSTIERNIIEYTRTIKEIY